jgi:hypothetical protein
MSRLNCEIRKDLMKARCASARANLHKPKFLTEERWEQAFGGGEGFSIEDGWARIFALSKMGRLYMFARARIAEAWMAPLSPEAREIEEMTKWPLSTLPKQNPFRQTYFSRTVVQAPVFDKGSGQYKVTFDCKPSISFYFHKEMMKAPGLDGWLVPRKQRQTFPWEQEGGIIIPEGHKPRMFVPKLSVEEMNMLLSGNKAQVIRNLHQRHADDMKNKVVCVMDIKEGVDKLLASLEE